MEPVVKGRRYDGTNRRRQAAQTQLRILHAAQRLFLRDGYAATTIAAIADEADVAVQTVYASTKSKREILMRILDLAVSGEEDQVAVQASARWREIQTEPDPRARLDLFVRLHGEICLREAPAFAVMVEAAGSDLEIRALQRETAERRYEDQYHLAALFQRDGCLRRGMSTRRAADIIWTLASERTYLALVCDRGWTTSDYGHWLKEQLVAALLN